MSEFIFPMLFRIETSQSITNTNSKVIYFYKTFMQL